MKYHQWLENTNMISRWKTRTLKHTTKHTALRRFIKSYLDFRPWLYGTTKMQGMSYIVGSYTSTYYKQTLKNTWNDGSIEVIKHQGNQMQYPKLKYVL